MPAQPSPTGLGLSCRVPVRLLSSGGGSAQESFMARMRIAGGAQGGLRRGACRWRRPTGMQAQKGQEEEGPLHSSGQHTAQAQRLGQADRRAGQARARPRDCGCGARGRTGAMQCTASASVSSSRRSASSRKRELTVVWPHCRNLSSARTACAAHGRVGLG